MKNHYVTIQITSVILVAILVYYLGKLSESEATYIKSNVTNREYLVQNLDDKTEASDLLGRIHQRIMILKQYLHQNIDKYPEFKPYIKQFCNRIHNVTLTENAFDGKYTSYTVNKGEEIALCLRSKSDGKLHNINIIMYVVLHELSHVACPEIDHTPLFKKIFVFYLQTAIKLQIYEYVDCTTEHCEYCGLTIKENLLQGKI